jgi:hypothetical protein
MPTSSKDDAEKPASACGPMSPGNFAPTPWFQSNLVTSSPKITRKKVGHRDSVETSIIAQTSPDPEPGPCLDYDLFSNQDADQGSQVYVGKCGKFTSSSKDKDGTTAGQFVNVDMAKATVEQQTKQSPRQKHSDHVSPRSLEVDTLEEPLVYPVHHLGETAGPSIALDVYQDNAVDFEPAHTPDTTLDLMSPRSFSLPSAKAVTPTVVTPENVAKPRGETKYTWRQMARAALVAANGSRMTTSQIIVWLAHTFPQLRVGKGSWEGSIRQTLSTFPEFHGQLIPGTRGNKKLYGFASAAHRTQFETMYPEFHTPPDALDSQVEYQQETISDVVTQTGERTTEPMKTITLIKSAVAFPTSTLIPKHRPSNRIITPKEHIPSTQSKHSSIIMPFERPGSRLSAGAQHDDLRMKRVITPPTIYTRVQHPADTMSEADQAQKIAEIRARPSRKQYFGSDHRLAHKRWRGLKDIHDESDGAWKRPASEEKQSEEDGDVSMDDEDERTLKGAFGLPDNMILMNDGHSELAFRDGTLVSDHTRHDSDDGLTRYIGQWQATPTATYIQGRQDVRGRTDHPGVLIAT